MSRFLRFACFCSIIMSNLLACAAKGGGGMVAIGTTKPDLFGLPAEYRALHPALEECLGSPVRFNAQPTGRAIGQQLEQGNIAFALLSAGEYAAVPDPSKLTLLASAVNPLGKTSRSAHVVCRASDSRFKTISDCQGKRFAFGTYGDPLTDFAARSALERSGVSLGKLLPELLPPPFQMEGRLYVQNDVPSKIMLDLTVNAGVIDEVVFAKLPETGGNPITGPSKDQFRILGDTMAIPEMVVVAGPLAEPALVAKLKECLLTKIKDNPMVCQQLGIRGFAEADRAAYDAVVPMLRKKAD